MASGASQAAGRFHWRSSARFIAVALGTVGVVGCTEFGEIRSELARLRADLTAHHAAMASLTERVEAVEQRLITSESGAAHQVNELHTALEVLLKKALEVDVRVARLETAKNTASQAPLSHPAVPQSAVDKHAPPIDQHQEIRLGMTQEEVRQIVGEPLRTEYTGEYIFWHYLLLGDQKYVVFDRESGRVSGWFGL